MKEFLSEKSKDTVIRRYMSFDIFQKLIESQSLYFSRFDSFEDRLEGGLNKSNFSCVSNSLEIFDLAMSRFPSADGKPNSTVTPNSIYEASFKTIFGPQNKINGEAYLSKVASWLYASCWTDIPHECQAMWQLYGSSGAGCRHPEPCIKCSKSLGRSMCVETTVGALIENLEVPPEYGILARKVEYIDHNKEFFDEEDIAIRPLFAKALHFSYENEFRILLWPKEKDIKFSYKYKQSSVNDVQSVLVPIKDLNAVIKRITLSPLPPKEQKIIQQMHREKNQYNFGLTEALQNHDLRKSVQDMLSKAGITAEIIDSDLNRASIDSYYDL